ncbi:hypothetical protein O181_015134 [Austropuccinia psidii MF-1]|uniref:Uncharacterized protein n=1 Tax=Austropuccinia psidii MF-1 TaxID=1389203 RepID=A0A9Q3GQJ2_9BASI|nr:hypothetical protein [Austropuccinia psidii MF-1]
MSKTHILQDRPDLRQELMLSSLQHQEHLLMGPQKFLNQGFIWTEDQSWNGKHHPEGRKKTRRSKSFSGVVEDFPGISRTTLKGPGEDDAEEEENTLEGEEYDSTEATPTPVGSSQGISGPTLA